MPCKIPLPLLIQDQKPKPKPGQKAPKARKTEKPENARTVTTIWYCDHTFWTSTSSTHRTPPTQKSPMKLSQRGRTALPSFSLRARLAPKMPLLIHLLNNELGGAAVEKKEGREWQRCDIGVHASRAFQGSKGCVFY